MTENNGHRLYTIIPQDSIDSSSNFLSRYCGDRDDKVADFTTVTAEFQQAGKGQKGNHWEGEAGKNLLFSFVVYPGFIPTARQFVISQLDSVALKETLDAYTDGISIKWPNDIYWHDKKISGMLIEVFLEGGSLGRCISGIGVNLNQTRFTSDAPNPVSLKQITGLDIDRVQFLDTFMQRAIYYYDRLKADFAATAAELEDSYARSLYRREGLYQYRDKDGLFRASLVRVEPDGRFVLRDESGHERSYLFKEVQYVI